MIAILLALTFATAGSAWAQAYPTKPIRFVVPFAPNVLVAHP